MTIRSLKHFTAAAACLVALLVPGSARQGRRSHPLTLKTTPMSFAEGVGNDRNLYYTLSINLGGESLTVIPDTGSFALVVTSTLCPEEECPRRTFDPAKASGYKSLGNSTLQEFGSGKLWTVAAKAPMAFGPSTVKREQNFRQITKMDSLMQKSWDMATFDGILGLSWVSQSNSAASAVSFNESSVLSNFGVESFAVCLTKRVLDINTASWSPEPSRFYWNRPQTLGKQNFVHVDVVGDGHWQVKMSRVAIKAKDSRFAIPIACFDEPCTAAIDSGTGTWGVPNGQFLHVWGSVGRVALNCDNFAQLPNIHFHLGAPGAAGIDVDLSPDMYVDHLVVPVYPGMSGGGSTLKGNKTESCVNMLTPHGITTSEGSMWVLGQPFLWQYLVEYDHKNKRVGLMKKSGRDCPGKAEEVKSSINLVEMDSGMVNMKAMLAGTRQPDARSLLGDSL